MSGDPPPRFNDTSSSHHQLNIATSAGTSSSSSTSSSFRTSASSDDITTSRTTKITTQTDIVKKKTKSQLQGEQGFIREQESVSSWTTEEDEEEEEDEDEDKNDHQEDGSSGSENSLSEEDKTTTSRLRRHHHRRRRRTNSSSTTTATPSPVLLSSRRPPLLSVPKLSLEERKKHYQSLPLRTQIRLLIERALARQLQENFSPNPKRGWIRRHIDTFFLRLLVFIMRYHRELCLLFLVFASGLASLRTSPMKTRSTPEPKPFFDNPKSLQYIDDFYRGEYMDLVKNKISLGPAFVFYYAPWDSESVASRNVFINVARYYRYTLPNRIRFYAVNCWWPQGECRKNYKNLSHFPIFVAHVERNMGIIYSGPIRAELIIKFLNSILKPLTRIDSEDELWRFRAQHDAILLSYFNFTEGESVRSYETYRQMALRSFESDPFGQVGYGIFLKQDLALKYFLTSSNVISLVLFNEIHTAKWTGEKDATGTRGPVSQVANWVMERTKKTPITWAYQIRTGFANRAVALGPMDLVDELSRGPVILLITRRYFPSSYSPFFAQVKEVALDYFNCNKSGNVTRLRKVTHQINSEWMTLWNSVSKICAAQVGPPSDTCILLRDQLKHWNTKRSSLRRESLASYNDASERMNFTGFSCDSDRQFKFVAIDPIDMPYFVELGFGGLGFNNDSDPVLFIIDAQNDMILPFSTFNITDIAEVIYNYTNDVETNEDASNFVSNYWSSSVADSSRNRQRTNAPHNSYSFAKELVKHGQNLEDLEESPVLGSIRQNLVMNLNSQDVQKLIAGVHPFHLPTPLFLMYTAKFCGACGISLTSFVDLSRFMADYYYFGVNITFAKIDMLQNSLPGPLSPEKLPTFVFFPGNDRADFRVFPADEKITTKTLLQFLLSELDPESRISLSLQSPGCSNEGSSCTRESTVNSDNPHLVKRHQAGCISQDNPNTNLTSSRETCISSNKISVADKLQLIFNEIQNGYYSQPQLDDETHLGLGVNIDTLKTQDLDHLRAMKITLDVFS